MGREAQVEAEVGDAKGSVKALLEARSLILRGAIRRDYPRAIIENPHVAGSFLVFECQGERVSLALGAKAAASWLTAILTPPPDLRAKLGLNAGTMAWVMGDGGDPDLIQALEDARAASLADAAMVIAMIEGPADLAEATARAGRLPLWVVHPKGKGVAFGDGPIRAVLRAAGWRDTKSCAVSDRLTATRYHPG